LALGATYWFAIQTKRPLEREGKDSIIKKEIIIINQFTNIAISVML